ncbi:MAG: type II secretion system protein [Jatrophihabitans sp.]|uniref:type II secretion system protein n=1 Tax=Jatrophihabitans sp. TaxID=1932789 RepID=UPI003F7DE892
MTAMLLLGAALGALLFALIWLLVPRRTSPLVGLGRYDAHLRAAHQPRVSTAPLDPGAGSWRTQLGARVVAELARHGITYRSLQHDLAVTGTRFDVLMGRKVLAAVSGFLLSLLLVGWWQYAAPPAASLQLPAGAPLLLAAIVAVILFVAPDVDVRKLARRRREEFTDDLAVFLELVSLEMAGYAAAETALPQAARRGGTWSMLLIRETLVHARLAGDDPWLALAALGERIGVPELRELGSLIKNVSDDGAQVRRTLSARAASLRRKRLAAEEGHAATRNQSMRLAQLLIAVGFMVFVGYPAFAVIRL